MLRLAAQSWVDGFPNLRFFRYAIVPLVVSLRGKSDDAKVTLFTSLILFFTGLAEKPGNSRKCRTPPLGMKKSGALWTKHDTSNRHNRQLIQDNNRCPRNIQRHTTDIHEAQRMLAILPRQHAFRNMRRNVLGLSRLWDLNLHDYVVVLCLSIVWDGRVIIFVIAVWPNGWKYIARPEAPLFIQRRCAGILGTGFSKPVKKSIKDVKSVTLASSDLPRRETTRGTIAYRKNRKLGKPSTHD